MNISTLSAFGLDERLDQGFVIGTYRVVNWAGTGGMALVYRGEHVRSRAPAALKVMSKACARDPLAHVRFDREVAVLKRLHACDGIAHWQTDGMLPDHRRFVALDWAPGDDLEQLLEEYRNNDERIDPLVALEVARDLAGTLAQMHAAGIVHRDLKPSNIIVDRARTVRLTTLLDFGIAADLDDPQHCGELTQGEALGTDAYAAPEQLVGVTGAPAMDLWSFGAVVYEMFGRYRATPELRTDGLPEHFTLRTKEPWADAVLDVIRRCLSIHPLDRPSAAQVFEALDAFVPKPDAAEVVEHLRQGPRPVVAAGELCGTDPGRPSDSMVAASPVGSTVVVRSPLRGRTAPVLRAVPRGETQPSADAYESGVRFEIATIPRTDTRSSVLRSAIASPTTFATPAIPDSRDDMPRTGSASWIVAGIVLVLFLGIVTWQLSSTLVHSLEGEDTPRTTIVEAAPEHIVPPQRNEAVEVVPTPMAAPTHTTEESRPRQASTRVDEERKHDATRSDLPRPRRDRTPRQKRPSPAPTVRLADTSACNGVHEQARQAHRSRAWTKVLEDTTRKQCWTSDQERSRLRVNALLNLGRFEQCVREGAGATDPDTRALVATCNNLRKPRRD